MTPVHQPSVQVNGSCHSHGVMDPTRIVLHSTEGPDSPGVTDETGVDNYWNKQGLEYGAHLIVDAAGNTLKNNDWHTILWHTGLHNTGSIGIEQVGYAAFPEAKWIEREAQLQKVAKWLAYLSAKFYIPLVHNTSHGVCLHSDFYVNEGDHTDPGGRPNKYPLQHVLDAAHEFKIKGW